MNPHIHKFKFETKILNNHKHRLMGCTDYMIGIDTFHIHYYYGISSYNGHTHYFSGFTGFPIKTANGHIHRMEGTLELNLAHVHNYKNYTEEDVEYIKKRILKKLYIATF